MFQKCWFAVFFLFFFFVLKRDTSLLTPNFICSLNKDNVGGVSHVVTASGREVVSKLTKLVIENFGSGSNTL